MYIKIDRTRSTHTEHILVTTAQHITTVREANVSGAVTTSEVLFIEKISNYSKVQNIGFLSGTKQHRQLMITS